MISKKWLELFLLFFLSSDSVKSTIFENKFFEDFDLKEFENGENDESDSHSISPISFKNDLTTDQSTIKAVALIKGLQIFGVVRLTQTGHGPTEISGFVKGLYPYSLHGFHVHQFKVTGGNCESAGEHYNPTKQNHGSPGTYQSHVGDLGNLQADAYGISKFNAMSFKLSLHGKFSIIGRAIVVHQKTDDLGLGYNQESLKSGNSGNRIGCGTIKFVSII